MQGKTVTQFNLRFFAFLRQVHCFIRIFLKDCHLDRSDEQLIYKVVILYHYNKMFSNSKAGYRLIKLGYLNEADIIIRSFIDTYVNICYIDRRPELRLLQYRLDELNSYLESRVKLKSFDKEFDKKIIHTQISETASEIKKIRDELKRIDPSGDYSKFRWKNISVEDKFSELNMEQEYNYIFLRFSQIVHPGSTMASSYLDYNTANVSPVVPPILDDMIIHRLMLFTEYLLDISFLVHNKVHQNGKNKIDKSKLKILVERFNNLNPLIE